MFLVIPSIDLQNHKCRYIVSGEKDTEDFYAKLSATPELLCKLFRLENVKSIHINDLDSFNNPDDNNIDNICLMTEATFLPFQALVNFQTVEECRKTLEYGVHRIVLADFAAINKNDTQDLINEYSASRIIFHLPVKNGKVYFSYSDTEYEIDDYLIYLKELGATRVILHLNEGELHPPENILSVLKDNFRTWTYQYDAANYDELKELKALTSFNMDSLIIGKSFYSTNYPCQKIWRIAEACLDAAKGELITD